jgi:hypothetical protein
MALLFTSHWLELNHKYPRLHSLKVGFEKRICVQMSPGGAPTGNSKGAAELARGRGQAWDHAFR